MSERTTAGPVPSGSAMPSGLAAAARCLALDQHAVVVTRTLTDTGIASMILKGPGLARRLYADDPSRRRYSDIDLLVSPADFEQAQRVLADLGHVDVAAHFPRDAWLDHERSWVIEGPLPLTVDLHRGFAGVEDPEALWGLLSASAEPLPLNGHPVLVPDAVGCALLIGLHAAAPGRGRKALTDLEMALDQLSDQVWAEAARAARTVRAEAGFATGLRRWPAGVDLARRLGLADRTTVTGRVAGRLDLMLLDRSLAGLAAVPGLIGKARYVARRLVPTPDFLRRATPLARRGPGGLVLAYLIRPLRLLIPAARDRPALPIVGRLRRGRRRAARLAGWSFADWRVAAWALRTHSRIRRDLVRRPLDEVRVPAPPIGPPSARRTAEAVLRARGASCLERSLIIQRWLLAHGRPTDLIVGVTAPGSGFHAHAWLVSDRAAEHNHATMTELLRRPATGGPRLSPGAADLRRPAD